MRSLLRLQSNASKLGARLMNTSHGKDTANIVLIGAGWWSQGVSHSEYSHRIHHHDYQLSQYNNIVASTAS